MMNFRDYNNGSLLTYLSNLYMGRYYSYMNRDEFNNIKMLQRQLAEMPEGFNTRENLVRLLGEDGFDLFSTYSRVLDGGIDALIREADHFMDVITNEEYLHQINDILGEKNTKKTELELRKTRIRFNEYMDDVFYRITHDIYDNPNRKQFEESYAQVYELNAIHPARQFNNEQPMKLD